MPRKVGEIVSGLAVIAALLLPVSTTAAPVAATSPLAMGKTALTQKNYGAAVKHFALAVRQNPDSCECRLGHGKALCKLAASLKKCPQQSATYKQGVQELRKAIRLGRGSKNAIEANSVLMSLPTAVTAPKSGEDTPLIALKHGINGQDRAGGEPGKPKILEFYASWCEPCKQLKPLMEKIKSTYGDQVEFISYNVDDPETEKVVEDYEVSPIPTLIFLDPNNQVVSYSVGYSGEVGVQKGLKKILAPGT